MATSVKESRRRKRRSTREATKVAAPKKRRHKARAATTVAAPKKRRRHKARAVTAVAAPRRRRRRASSLMMEAKKPRRRAKRRRARVAAWKGNSAGHRKAALKGARRRKRKSPVRRRRSRVREHVYEMQSPRRRRRSSRRRLKAQAPRRTTRRYRAHASKRGGHADLATRLAISAISAGIGFVLADGVDRFLATYDASKPEKPKDKFTSDGAGTLANTLNIAQSPDLLRIAAGIGMTALPAVGSAFVSNPLLRAGLEGAAIGAGVKLFSTFWSNVVMGHWLSPKNTDAETLKKSVIARLYPAEVAASINLAAKQTAAPAGAAFGGLSEPQQMGVGADVGPFALSALGGDSPYADAGQALRQAAGLQGYLQGDSPYLDASQALRRGAGLQGESQYPSAQQALQAGVNAPAPIATDVTRFTPAAPANQAYAPGPPPGFGPGPQATPHKECGCIGENNTFLGFIGDESTDSLSAAMSPGTGN